MPFDLASDSSFDSPSLAVLGWDASRVAELAELSSTRGIELTPGRVARVDRGALTVLAGAAPMRVRPSGRLFEQDAGPGEPIGTPAVGDWVALDGPVAVAVLSRRSTFERSSSNRQTVAQSWPPTSTPSSSWPRSSGGRVLGCCSALSRWRGNRAPHPSSC